MTQQKTASILQNISRYTLLVFSILIMIFALFSGAEEGFNGLLRNSLNALPWFVLLLLVLLTWKWTLLGGILITVLGLFGLYFFNSGPNFWWITFFITLLPVCLGMMLLIGHFLDRGHSNVKDKEV